MNAGDWFEHERLRIIRAGAKFLNAAWRARGIWPTNGECTVTMPVVAGVQVVALLPIYEAWRRSVDTLLWADFQEPATDAQAERWWECGYTPDLAAFRIRAFRESCR